MPIIPLPTQERPLPNVPDPVLNRERVPIKDTRGVEAAVARLGNVTMPELPADKLSAPYRALGAVGEAIQQTGSVVSAAAIKQREVETDVQVGRARDSMKAAMMDYEANKGNDPLTWSDTWDKTVGPLKDQLLADPNLHDAARTRIGIDYDSWSRLGGADVLRQQRVATNQLAAKEFESRLGTAIQNQARPDFDATWAEGEKKGLLFSWMKPEYDRRFTSEGERLRKKAEADSMDTARNSVAGFTAGKGAPDALKAIDDGLFGDFAPADKETLKAYARQVGQQSSGDALDAVADGIAGGSITSAARVDEIAHDNPHLPPRVVEKVKKEISLRDAEALRKDREQNGIKNAVALRQQVQTYDPSADKDGEQYYTLRQAIQQSVPDGMRNDIANELHEKFTGKPGSLPGGPEIQQYVDKSLRRIFDPKDGLIKWQTPEVRRYQKDDTTWHIFSPNEVHKQGEPMLDSKGQPQPLINKNGQPEKYQVDQQARQRAIDAETNVRTQLDDWMRLNPQKASDPAAVKAQLMRVLPEGTRASALDSFSKLQQQKSASTGDLRGFVPADDLVRKLPAGLQAHAQDFIEAGKQYNLNPRVLAAISSLETGGGTSKAFREKNNAMGISDDHGPLALASVRDSIFRQAKTLASEKGPYAKARTLDEIAHIYAPVGAANDFKGTNGGWADGVRSYLARL